MLEKWEDLLLKNETQRQEKMNVVPKQKEPLARKGGPSSSDRFAMIDRATRQQLRTTHLPQGVVHAIEDKLLRFFSGGGGGKARKLLCDDACDSDSAGLLDWEVISETTSSTSDSTSAPSSDNDWVDVGAEATAKTNAKVSKSPTSNKSTSSTNVAPFDSNDVLAAGCRPGRLQIYEPNSFNRCLLHAVVQYMGLVSVSETVADGRRITTVTNKQHPAFTPPDVQLSESLQPLEV